VTHYYYFILIIVKDFSNLFLLQGLTFELKGMSAAKASFWIEKKNITRAIDSLKRAKSQNKH